MANQNNSPGITGDDIQKTKEYSEALDKLQSSLTSVNTALPKFADGVETGLKAVAEKLPEVIAAMTKLNIQNQELAANGQKPISVFSQLAASLFSWNNLVSVGITLLTTYGGTIIKWVADMIKGETTLSAFAKTMRDSTILANALIQTKLQASKAAQSEITDLNVLYRATQDHTRSLVEKRDVIKALKKQWPDTFKNISDEAIATGKAANAYKSLKEQILAAAMAEAAKNKITANYGRILENNEKINRERVNNLAIVDKQKKAQEKYDAYAAPLFDEGFGNKDQEDALDSQTKLRAASDKIITDTFTDNNRLNAQIERFYQEIDKSVQKYGPGIAGHKLQANHQEHVESTSRSVASSNVQKDAERFAQKVETTKKQYETEQANFKLQLTDKQITQNEYDNISKQLQDKYLSDLKEKIGLFNEQDLEQTLQHQKELVEAQQLSEDQHTVDKAILPAQKLAAEKQLIEDKYNFEIQKAAEAGKDTALIREQYQQAITDATKKHEQERKDFELQTTQQVSNAAFSILQNSIKSQNDAKIKQLETQKSAELRNSSLTSSQKQAIEEKYKKKEADEKTKAFKAEQRASILQAVINGALAITKVTAQSGILGAFVIPGIIAETAIQVATIAAQKTPQYAKGGLHYQSDGKGAMLPGYSRTDNTNAYLRSGEAVVVSEAMRDPWARNMVSAINVAYGGRDFSMSNPGRGYAIGGIFSDGGNSNRYYNQPMNDQKDLANTIAYQMINNFPPVYVDVKDINSQQNILAKTVNRVNL
ncbi:MAG: hypothetical protein V4560_18310 [Bacteroidota bacterium]